MEIQTFSIVVGSRACDAHCPFCISKQTGMDELPSPTTINERNLKKALHLAKLGDTTTCLITGKGEPTLYPDCISSYMERLYEKFPLIELQTNGIQIGKLAEGRETTLGEGHLRWWHNRGLDTIALSVAGIDSDFNTRIYNKDYPDLANTISYLHGLGFSVRLCVMMMREGVDSIDKLKEVIRWCYHRDVDQLTVRPIRQPKHPGTAALDVEIHQFMQRQGISDAAMDEVRGWVCDNGTHLLPLFHGADVYDVGGQNVCVSDCLTLSKAPGEIRTLIYYGNGRISYDWQHRGAVLLGAHGTHGE